MIPNYLMIQQLLFDDPQVFDDPQQFDDPQLSDDQLEVWTLINQMSTVIPPSPMVLFFKSQTSKLHPPFNYRTFIQGRCNVPFLKVGSDFPNKTCEAVAGWHKSGLSGAQKLLVGTKVERFMASCRSKLLLLLLSTEYASAASQKMVAAPENLLLGLK